MKTKTLIKSMIMGAITYYLLGAYLTWSFDYITHISEWDINIKILYLFLLFIIISLWNMVFELNDLEK